MQNRQGKQEWQGPKGRSKILIVDDDPTSVATMERILNDAYQLVTANCGEEALELAPTLVPDLILLDILMPGIDGYETCRGIRAYPTLQHTKVIVVSRTDVVSERLEAYEAGADDCLAKPFVAEELLAKVRVSLRLKATEDALQQAHDELEQRVQARTEELANMNEILRTELTERRRAEDALRDSEERFALAVRGTYDGLWDWNLITDEVYYSARLEELLGYAEHELGTHFESFEALLHPEDAERVSQAIRGHCEHRTPYDVEWRGQTKGGEYRWFRARGQAVWDEKGSPVRMAGSIRDITEHKEMEESLRKSEARFALAMQGTDEGLWDWDIVTNEAYFAPRFRELLGYPADEFWETLESFTSRLHPDDYDGTQKAIQAHLEDRIPYDREYRLQTKNGKYRWFHERGQAMWDAQGNPVRMAGSIRDITERRQAETALRESEERFRILSTSSPIGIFQTDTSGAVVYTNPMWRQISGQTLQESLGLGWTKTIEPEDQEAVAAAWQAYVKGEQNYSQEYRLVRPDGELRWVHVQALDVRSETGALLGYVGTAEDITKRKQAEELVQADLERAQRIQKGFLPKKFPLDRGLTFAARYRPSLQIGGDFFDVRPQGKSQVAMLMADVSGHGVPAAMLTGVLKVLFQSGIEQFADPGSLLRWLNEALPTYLARGEFLTAFLGIWRPETSTLHYAGVGHPSPLLVLGEGSGVELLEIERGLVGIETGALFTDMSVQLEPGQRLVLYTDGITEAGNTQRELFGEERLIEVCNRAAGEPVESLVESVFSEVAQFSQGQVQMDDQAILAMEATG